MRSNGVYDDPVVKVATHEQIASDFFLPDYRDRVYPCLGDLKLVIRSFGDERTHDVFHGLTTARARRLGRDVVSACVRRLDYLEAAVQLRDLQSPPGNRLEALSGDLAGYYSIRVNDQWRIVFRWQGRDAFDVILMDYH